MNVIFLGPNGAGKGTQAKLLQEREGLPQVSTGDILRRAMADPDSPLGTTARRFINRGELVPDDVMIEIIEARLREPDTTRGFVLDGFPRTIAQARALDDLLQAAGHAVDAVVYFEARPDTIVRRLSGRRLCRAAGHIYHVEFQPPVVEGRCDIDGSELYQREDDREETVRHRLSVYRRRTEPLVDYYRSRGILETIDAEADVEEVYRALTEILAARTR
ncbi:MAG TPA: adenylate kinase [bacterium]|nr:adenylate kinase [bacterium]